MESSNRIGVILMADKQGVSTIKTICQQSRVGNCVYRFTTEGVFYFSSGNINSDGEGVSFNMSVHVHEATAISAQLSVDVEGMLSSLFSNKWHILFFILMCRPFSKNNKNKKLYLLIVFSLKVLFLREPHFFYCKG